MSNGSQLANPNNAGKETIYVDVDDEITTIIDKVRSSSQKIVALVLPKRATMLQSIVNMKLLKRTGEQAKKNLVLITTESGLLPLAGGVGLHVAKNLQSKPEIPETPNAHQAPDDIEEALSMDDEQLPAAKLDASKSIGDLAVGSIPASAVEDTIDLDDEADATPNMPATDTSAATKAAKRAKKTAGSKFKVPNFNRFRLLLVLGGCGIVLLIVAWILCFDVLPKATITVKTNASNVSSNLNITLSTTATSVSSDTVPAQMQQIPKTYTQQVASTGQQDNGTKASGTVTITAGACTGTAPNDVPAGTGVTSGGLTFVTQNDTTFVPAVHNKNCTWTGTSATPVVAQNNGVQYNVGPSTFTVAGRSDVSASSNNPMSGGTSNIVKVVAQADIDSAKQQIAAQSTTAIKQQLASAFQTAGLYAVQATFQAGTPTATTSANVGDQADTVTVTENVTYTMFGAKQQDLHQLVANNVDTKIDTSRQVILDDGLSSASFTLQSQAAGKAVVALQDTAIAGPDLKVDSLRTQVAGKKAIDAENIIKSNPGVTDVNVSYSPFWVSAIPKNTNKISIVIEKPQNDPGSD